MIKLSIVDGKGRGKLAEVSEQGELITRPGQYSTSIKKQITDSNAVNFFKPESGKKFIVTAIIVNTDRNVGVNGSAIEVYETTAEDSTTVTDSIVALDLAKNQTTPLVPLLIETTEGRYINGKADDFNVNISVLGYFVDV